ncbi:hypothetical protein AAHA92_33815 [Salvia divinorum]|uniref:Uncharacterized protein n=1 Tax=Salvia divinorum TaxID=28513 RepID=A0ABD1FGX2_SALDI
MRSQAPAVVLSAAITAVSLLGQPPWRVAVLAAPTPHHKILVEDGVLPFLNVKIERRLSRFGTLISLPHIVSLYYAVKSPPLLGFTSPAIQSSPLSPSFTLTRGLGPRTLLGSQVQAAAAACSLLQLTPRSDVLSLLLRCLPYYPGC